VAAADRASGQHQFAALSAREMQLASAGGNRVPVIAQLVQAEEDTVRGVVHRLNEIGLACLDPQWAGGRARLLSPDDEDFVIRTATTGPTRLG
jgi:transposase